MFKIIIALSFITLAHSSEWSNSNNPFKLVSHLQTELVSLPLDGKLKDQRLGWPGNHWANFLGGIAHRWSSSNPQNFTYKLHTLSELQKLEPHELDELSPAEKFDITNGNYNYPTVRKIFKRLSPYESEWHGICHGYAPAAINHPEPASITKVNADGLAIYFYSSDVAGLLSYYYANEVSTPVVLIGSRCNYGANSRIPRRARASCDDLNAGAFHLVLANKLGLLGTGIIVDMERYSEVWNHVAVNYQTRYYAESVPTRNSARGTLKRVQVETIVTYAAAIAPKFDPVLGTAAAEYAQNTYEYFLDIDSAGKVIGGDWISENRPDFIWSQSKAEFINGWSSLAEIYHPAPSI